MVYWFWRHYRGRHYRRNREFGECFHRRLGVFLGSTVIHSQKAFHHHCMQFRMGQPSSGFRPCWLSNVIRSLDCRVNFECRIYYRVKIEGWIYIEQDRQFLRFGGRTGRFGTRKFGAIQKQDFVRWLYNLAAKIGLHGSNEPPYFALTKKAWLGSLLVEI